MRRVPGAAQMLAMHLARQTATPALALCAMLAALAPAQPAAAQHIDRQAASFPLCGQAARVSCVVDGDTFWYRGDKIRIADINTPETTRAGCPREAELGRAATLRLQQLLAQGPFTLAPAPDGRDKDRYGRLLRTVTRSGRSLGDQLVQAGLAETWQGRRGDWCAAD